MFGAFSKKKRWDLLINEWINININAIPIQREQEMFVVFKNSLQLIGRYIYIYIFFLNNLFGTSGMALCKLMCSLFWTSDFL